MRERLNPCFAKATQGTAAEDAESAEFYSCIKKVGAAIWRDCSYSLRTEVPTTTTIAAKERRDHKNELSMRSLRSFAAN